MTNSLAILIPQLAQRRVLVLGDVVLDEYVLGKAQRMSREAPIPVLEFESRRYIPGGAANPANNIVTLGSAALQVGIVGEDETAAHLRAALDELGIETDGLVSCPQRPTTLKTRILAQMGLRFPQQVARVDTLSRVPIDESATQQVLSKLQQHLSTMQALLISDYHNGLLTPHVVNTAKRLAAESGVPLFVDAQGALHKYRAVQVVKCNTDDASDYLRRSIRTQDDFTQAAAELRDALAVQGAMVITRGAEGATVAEADGTVFHVPAPQVSDVFDTVGAGDTWIAVLTLARLAGASYYDAALLANVASGIVVRHVGNYTPTPDELREALSDDT